MQTTKDVKKLFRFYVGTQVYVKEEIINSRSTMIVNGKDVAKILLQHASIIVTAQLEVLDEESYIISYVLRPRNSRFESQNAYVVVREHELCNEEEATAILRLKDSA